MQGSSGPFNNGRKERELSKEEISLHWGSSGNSPKIGFHYRIVYRDKQIITFC